jgi:hypothetical protein
MLPHTERCARQDRGLDKKDKSRQILFQPDYRASRSTRWSDMGNRGEVALDNGIPLRYFTLKSRVEGDSRQVGSSHQGTDRKLWWSELEPC